MSMVAPDAVEPANAPDASVIVLGYRSVEPLAACLESLRSHPSAASFEVIVVLNGAAPEVVEVVDAADDVRVVRSWANRGFAGGCNLGARHALGRHLVFLNDDALVEQGWLDGLVHVAATRPEVGVVGSLLLDAHGAILEFGGKLHGLQPEALERGRSRAQAERLGPRYVDYVSGCSLLIERALFESIGGFDEHFYPAYFEDADLCRRVWAEGRAVVVTPASPVTHLEGESSSPVLYHLIFERARHRFTEKWRNTATPVPDGVPRALPRIVFFDDYLPRAAAGSGLGRARSLLEVLTGLGYWVQVVPWVEFFEIDPALAARGVFRVDHDEHLLESDPPAAVIASRPTNYERAARFAATCPTSPLLYDAEARFAARFETQRRLADYAQLEEQLAAEQARFESMEGDLASQVDAVVTISEVEADWFRDRGAHTVHVHDPFPERCEAGGADFASRRDALFVAGWLPGAQSPNGDGLRWLADEVLEPALGGTDAAVLVTGSSPPDELVARASEHLRFLGEIDAIESALDAARVAVVPIRYGAGVKIKAIDALSRGVPVVATTIGAEGIPAPWRAGMLIEDEPGRFAAALASVLGDEAVWRSLREPLVALCEAHHVDHGAEWAKILADATSVAEARSGEPIPAAAGELVLPTPGPLARRLVEPPTLGPATAARTDEDVVYLRREVEHQAVLIGRLLGRLDSAAAELADSRVEVDDLLARMLWAERRCAAIEARLAYRLSDRAATELARLPYAAWLRKALMRLARALRGALRADRPSGG
jgi:GT2 family glycosyltransferase/glycosyltransferase involved in cell wall biosynthesis